MGMDNNSGCGDNNKCFPTGWSVGAKLCDYCKSAAAVLFCRTDSFFMCMECDVKAHHHGSSTTTTTTRRVRHERVWMCEVCEHAPASVTCKADAAALCVTCDNDIHSANPLARRHERSPVVPFYETVEFKSTAATFLVPGGGGGDDSSFTTAVEKTNDGMETCVAVSHQEFDSEWNLVQNHMNPTKVAIDATAMKSIEYLLSDSDHFADFDYPVPVMDARFKPHNSSRTDSVVPVQVQSVNPPVPAQMTDHSKENHFEIDFTTSNINSYSSNYPSQTLSHSVSSSSLDVGIVPDGSSMSDMSYPFYRRMMDGGGGAVGANHQQATQLVGVDREARVLRYREKRKNRKFQKTIRYASRKAYAETRPRIKGRFAKRTEIDAEVVDRIFSSGSSAFMADAAGCGVVPSF